MKLWHTLYEPESYILIYPFQTKLNLDKGKKEVLNEIIFSSEHGFGNLDDTT